MKAVGQRAGHPEDNDSAKVPSDSWTSTPRPSASRRWSAVIRSSTDVLVDGALWLAAAATGGSSVATPGAPVFAHTWPVYVDVDGCRTARAALARWCRTALDALEELATAQGRFAPGRRDAQLADLVAVLDRARAVYRAVADHARAFRSGSSWGLVDGAGVLPRSRRIRRGTRSLGMAEVLLPAGRGRKGRLVAPPGATSLLAWSRPWVGEDVSGWCERRRAT
jgi:hypothetical protein